MTKDKEAIDLLKKIKAGKFELLIHAEKRLVERGLFTKQIINCAKSCFHWEWQEDKGTFLFIGFLLEDTSGGFIAVKKNKVLVVTVFKRKLSIWEKNLAKLKKL